MTSSVLDAKLWYVQRLSAMLLAACVVIHLVAIVVVTHQGLSAADILARTRGNAAFAAFYAAFVVAAAVHAPIGLRAVAREWLRWRGPTLDAACAAFAIALAAGGLRAVYAVSAP